MSVEFGEELTRWNYENLFKEMYNDKEKKKEGIYLLFKENPKVMKYLSPEEKAGVFDIVVEQSNLNVNNLKVKELNKELLKNCYAGFD